MALHVGKTAQLEPVNPGGAQHAAAAAGPPGEAESEKNIQGADKKVSFFNPKEKGQETSFLKFCEHTRMPHNAALIV